MGRTASWCRRCRIHRSVAAPHQGTRWEKYEIHRENALMSSGLVTTFTTLSDKCGIRTSTSVFYFTKCSSDEMSSLPFPKRFRCKHMGEIANIGETSTKFFCGPRRFLFTG